MSSDSSAYSVGYLIGQLIWPMVAIIVIIYQAQKLKMPDRSRFATFGLMLWAVAFLVITVSALFAKRIDDFQTQRIVMAAVGLLWFAIQTGSFLCAGVGAYETFRAKRRLKGRNLVVWSVLLGLIYSGVMGFGVYQGIQRTLAFNQSRNSEITGREGSSGTNGNGISATLDELNFGVELEGAGWARLDPKNINPDIALWLMNRKERLNYIVIAEPLGTAFDDTAVFEEVIKAGMEPQFDSIRFTPFETRTVGGREVRFSNAVGKAGLTRIEYRMHLFLENGCLYQVNLFTDKKSGFDGVDTGWLDELIAGFYLLDTDRFLGVAEGGRRSAFELPEFGFRLDLSDRDWMIWEDLAEDAPNFQDGALYPSGAAIGVMIVSDFDPDESMDVIAEAFFHAMDFEMDELQYECSKQAQLAELPAHEYGFSRTIDGEAYNYSMRIAKAETCGIAVVGWWGADKAKAPVMRALDGVSINVDAIEKVSSPGTQRNVAAAADILNAAGLAHYEESRFGKAASYFMRAYRKNPEMWVALQNVAQAAQNSEDYEPAIEFIEPEYAKHPGQQDLTLSYGLLLLYAGQIEKGYPLLQALFKEGYVDDDDLLTSINLLIEAEEYERAIEINRSAVAAVPSLKREAWLASVLRISGDVEGAGAYIAAVKEKYGDAPLVAEEEANILLQEANPRAALERIDEWVEAYGESIDAVELKIAAQLDLNWLADAKATVVDALEQYPGNESLLESNRWILAQIGEDDLNLIREPIAPVAMPNRINELLEDAKTRPEPAEWSDKSSIYDYRCTAYHFDPSKPMRTSTMGRVRLKDRSALEEYATLHFEFDRSYERLYINYVRVLDEEGALVGELERDSVYISENSDEEMATDSVTVFAPVASLQAGYTLEWQATWETNGIEDTFPYKSLICVSSVPRKERIVCVTGELDSVMSDVAGVREINDDSADYLAWHIQDTQSFHWERSMPDLTDFLPYVRLSNKKFSWQEVASDYFNDIKAYFEPDDLIRQLVSDQKLDGLSEGDKVVKLVRFAQERVVYKALEFGSRGRIPAKASLTWQNRYGDCKDQTVLLLQMLAAAEIESYPLLVSTENQVVEHMASMDQFNHMILYVPSLEQPFVDVVDANFDFSYGAPSGLGSSKGLIIQEGDGRIVSIPEYNFSMERPVASLNATVQQYQESEDDLIVNESVQLRGYYAMWMRNRFRELDRDRYDHTIRDYLNRYLPSGAHFVDTEIVGLRDLSRPLTLRASYVMPLEPVVISFRPLWEQFYLDIEPSATRLSPYRIHYPFTLTSSVFFHENAVLLDSTETLASEDSDIVSFVHEVGTVESSTAEIKNKGTFIVTSFGWPAVTLSPEEYFSYYAQLDRFKESAQLRLRPKQLSQASEDAGDGLILEVVASE